MTKEEFQKEVMPMGEKMYRIAYRLLGDSESARDVLQELFLKLWEKRNELHQLSSIDAFACTVLKNKCLDKLRLQKPTIDIEILKTQGNNPEATFDHMEGMSEIRKVMQLLPERQRIIMQMRDIEGCSFEEIALLADTTENNVRVQLCIARKWVKEELVKIYNYGI
ncbi:MAG: sigma-70 family RNA polymerase sigma factor [Bacteroidales bacterium]|nr:sigma-70 family RNA polymerase sigma factor [Bacteroidales bacterium]